MMDDNWDGDEHDETKHKQIDISLTVTRAKIVKGPKTDSFSCIATVEFGDTVLGTSEKKDVQEDNTFDFTLTVNITCGSQDYPKIEELVSKPIIITISEVVALMKKGVKEGEKNVRLCNCSVDVLPLMLSPDLEIRETHILHFVDGNKKPGYVEPEVELESIFSGHLLSPDIMKESNIVFITVEACFSLPDSLTSAEKDLYLAGFLFPTQNEVEEPIIYRNGTIEAFSESGSWHEKKWFYLNASDTSSRAVYIPNSGEYKFGLEDDFGEYQDEQGMLHRKRCESYPLLSWQTERRIFLTPPAVAKLRSIVKEQKILPIEIVRVIGGKGKKDEDFQYSHYAVAYVLLTPLAFPGVEEIHGAYKLHPVNEHDLKEKTNKRSLFFYGTPSRPGSALLLSLVKKNKDNVTEKSRQTSKGEEANDGGSTKTGLQADAYEFENANTYLTFSLRFHHSLYPRRSPEELTAKITELIPPRSSMPPMINNAQKAVEEFGTQVGLIASVLMEDYKSMLRIDAAGSQGKDRLTTIDYRKNKFLQDLKRSGKYFACKEQLKFRIVKIVREKFLRRSNFETKQEFQEFLSTLHVYLVEEMHQHLNQYISMNEIVAQTPVLPEMAKLKTYADDAWSIGRNDLALKYHQQRIAKYRYESECWVDYGAYHFGTGDWAKATECLHEAISLDQENYLGLILYAIASESNANHSVAETFLLAAVNSAPDNQLPCTVLGLYYQSIGNVTGAEIYYKKATKLLRETSVPFAWNSVESETSLANDRSQAASIFLDAVPFFLDCNALNYAERALSQELTLYQCQPPALYYHYLAKMKYMKKEYQDAETAIHQSIYSDSGYQYGDTWSLSGHIHYALGNLKQALKSYNQALAIVTPPTDLAIVYLKLSFIDLQENDHTAAKSNALLACKHSPSCIMWYAVGKACYELGELEDAEDALSEANTLDNTNPDVWAYLALVCLKSDQKQAAEQAYRYACKLANEVCCKTWSRRLVDICAVSNCCGCQLFPTHSAPTISYLNNYGIRSRKVQLNFGY